MKQLSSYILIPLIIATLFFGASFDVAHAQAPESPSFLGATFDVVGLVLSPVGYAIMQLASKITMLAGVALNASVYYTVVEMAKNFSEIKAVDEAWRVVRDLANMGFIFVLLYASIMTIVGKGEGKNDPRGLIVRMVIAAILINFSLFFTKVVIDVANLLALTFYSSMAPVATLTADSFMSAGVSNAMMDVLRINSLWQNRELLTPSNLFIITILSSVVLLIAAFVFFAVAIMFLIRYVVLIFVLILSPIAFVSGVLPGLDSIAKQWKEALIGQAFFAPIYFFLTWVTLFLAQNLFKTTFKSTGGFGTALAGADSSAMSILVNYAVIIIFLVVSLITAKKYADMAPSGVQKLTKWAMGAAGGATLGVAGWAGRRSFGAMGSAVGDSEALKKRAYNEDGSFKGGAVGAMARLGLAAGRKTAKQSFDIRGTALGGVLDAGKAQSGGFAEDMKQRAKEQKEFGESLKPSDIVIDEAQAAHNRANLELLEAKRTGDAEKIKKAQETYNTTRTRLDNLKGIDKKEQDKRKAKDIEEDPATLKLKGLEEDIKKKEEELKKALSDGEKDAINKELETLNKEIGTAKKDAESAKKRIEEDYVYREARGDFKSQGDRRKEGYAETIRDPRWIKSKLNPYIISKGDKQAAAELRKGKKPIKDQLEGILKEAGELKEKEEGVKEAVEDLTEKTEKGGGAGGAPSTS